MILIISSEQDDHALHVLSELEDRRIEARIIDLSRFPKESSVSIGYSNSHGYVDAWFIDSDDEIQLSQCSVIWWRRPQPFELHSDLASPVAMNFAYDECYSALTGLWLALDAVWVNPPARDEEAGRKPYQLKTAHDVGLQIPKTLITSDPRKAREFADKFGHARTVYKAFTGTPEAWRETRVLREEEMELFENVKYAPVIFQEYVPVQLDLRVTVIGKEIFASAIHLDGSSYEQDYRMDLSASLVEPYKLPNEIESRIRILMERLGLLYGAIDMRLTPDGRYVFLEINPSGQWLFMEHRTQQPMTSAFTDLLVSNHR